MDNFTVHCLFERRINRDEGSTDWVFHQLPQGLDGLRARLAWHGIGLAGPPKAVEKESEKDTRKGANDGEGNQKDDEAI